MLPTPAFHHLHLNSVDPAAAIARIMQLFGASKAGNPAHVPLALVGNCRT